MKTKNVKSIALKVGVVLLVLATLGSTAVLFGSFGSEAYKPPTSELVTPGNIPLGYIKGNGLYYKDAAKFSATNALTNALQDTLSGVNVLKNDYNVLLNNNGVAYGNNLGWIDVVTFDNNNVLSVGRRNSKASLRVDMESVDKTGSIYVFEADFMWLGTDGLNTGNVEYDNITYTHHLLFSFNESIDNTTNSFAKFYGVTNKSETDKLYLSFDKSKTSLAVLDKGVWVNFRAVYTVLNDTSGSIVLYLNNELVDQAIVSCTSNSLFEMFSIQIDNRIENTEFLLDNVYVSAIN